METVRPRAKVMCIINHQGKTLATKCYDKVKDEVFYRLIGGSLDFGETVEEGIRREIREELKCEIENLQFIKFIENIFQYEGINGHEIDFLFRGDLVDKSLYEKEIITIVEPYGEFNAEWISIDDVFSNRIILYPALDYSNVLK